MMKRLIIILLLVSGCGSMESWTPEERAAYFRGLSRTMQQNLETIKRQRMYDAQMEYYTRPYEMNGVIYLP